MNLGGGTILFITASGDLVLVPALPPPCELPPRLPVLICLTGTVPTSPTCLRVVARRRRLQGTPRDTTKVYLAGKWTLVNHTSQIYALGRTHTLHAGFLYHLTAAGCLPSQGGGDPQLPLPTAADAPATPPAHSPKGGGASLPSDFPSPTGGPEGKWM